MRVKQRRALFTDIVPFPASKSAGELTILGDELKLFNASNPGSARVQLVADDKSKITNTLSMNLQVSYDEGESWVTAGTYSELANGSGKVSVLKEDLEFAPEIRVNANFTSSGALAEGHGCKVHAELQEGDFQKYKVEQDIVTDMPETMDTQAIDAVASTLDFNLPEGIASGDSLIISDGTTTTEEYDFYDNSGTDYEGENTLVDIQGETPDIPALLTAAIEANSALVGAAETEGLISLTAKSAGIGGDDITVTINEGEEDPVEYSLSGGAEAISASSVLILGDIVSPEVENIEKVLVVSSCDSTKTDTIVSFVLQSSFDGQNWWNVNTSVDLDANFIETKLTSKLGLFFRVAVTIAEDKDLIADHNTKFNLITFYA